MGEHRVSMLGASLRRSQDPARSSDPKIRELVTQLATLEPGPAPSAHFRAELRAQLVAVAPRLVVEGGAETRTTARATKSVTTEAAEPRAVDPPRRSLLATLARFPLRRPVAIVGGVFTVFVLLLGGAVWISQRALPGDALYGLKRASESVQLSLTTGDTAKGKRYLSLAGTRADEASDLISKSSAAGPGITAAGISAHTASLVTSTLGSGDSDVRSATALLAGEAVRNVSTSPLAVIISWAPGQLTKLTSLAQELPAGALKTRVGASASLVKSALTRAQDLKSLSGCSCLSGAATDSLGPIPCRVCTGPPAAKKSSTPSTGPGSHSSGTPGIPGTGTSNLPGTTPTPGSTGRSTGGLPGVGAGSSTPGGGGAGATGSKGGGGVLPTSPGLGGLPTLPISTPTLPTKGPIATNSCGLSVSLGPIGVGVGTCGIHVGL